MKSPLPLLLASFLADVADDDFSIKGTAKP